MQEDDLNPTMNILIIAAPGIKTMSHRDLNIEIAIKQTNLRIKTELYQIDLKLTRIINTWINQVTVDRILIS